jgi:DNA-binding transcriptional MerR regulator
MFSIGEFSKITGLTVKSLRFYHEQDVLVPSYVDPQTGYRYYDASQIGTARAVAYLRSLDLPLNEVREVLRCESDEALLETMKRHAAVLRERIKRYHGALRSLDEFVEEERKARAMMTSPPAVTEKQLSPTLVAGIRMKGRYADCGRAFSKIARALGRHLCGNAMMLHYDSEYREDDADFEAVMPVRNGKSADGIDVRELPGGRCVSLLHKGPYDQLGRSYAVIFQHIKQKGYAVAMPTREVYLKGPGMIFKGNPKNYLTEIQVLIEQTGGQSR